MLISAFGSELAQPVNPLGNWFLSADGELITTWHSFAEGELFADYIALRAGFSGDEEASDRVTPGGIIIMPIVPPP